MVKDITINTTDSINNKIKKAFSAIGYAGDNMVTQISSALATIGQQIGELRNEIGTISHGRSLDELEERNSHVDAITREFLIDSTIIVACFLICTFENKNPLVTNQAELKLIYEYNSDFNNSWDDIYGEFEMGVYSYPASEILYNVDYEAYLNEYKAFSTDGEAINDQNN